MAFFEQEPLLWSFDRCQPARKEKRKVVLTFARQMETLATSARLLSCSALPILVT